MQYLISIIIVAIILYLFQSYLSYVLHTNPDQLPKWLIDQYKFDTFNYIYFMAANGW